MPPIARLVPTAAVVVLLAAGCGETADEPPAAADSPSVAAPSPSASAAPSTPAARQPHSLVVTATGTARVTSLTYELDGESTKVGAVKLPWRLSIDVPSDGLRHAWSVKLTHGKGKIEVRAIFDGKVVGTAIGSSTSGTGTASTGGTVLS